MLIYEIVSVVSDVRETGKVIELKGNNAVVELARSEACKTCGICHMGANPKKMLTEALNLAHAEIGDEIFIELEPKRTLIASFIVYILPLVFLVLGYLLGSFLSLNLIRQQFAEAGGIIIGFISFIISYLFIKKIDERVSMIAEFQPIITKKVKDSK